MIELIAEAMEIITNIKASNLPLAEKNELIGQVLYDVALQAELITEPIQENP